MTELVLEGAGGVYFVMKYSQAIKAYTDKTGARMTLFNSKNVDRYSCTYIIKISGTASQVSRIKGFADGYKEGMQFK